MTRRQTTQIDKQQLQTNFEHFFQQLQTQQANPITLYLENLAPSGRRSIRCALANAADIIGFTGKLETLPWQLIEYQHVALVRNALKQQLKAANTINLTLSALRGVMKACFNLKLISADQLLTINDIKPVRGQRLLSGRSLTNIEVQKLLRACKQDRSPIGKRDHALIALMLATGLRRSEVIALDNNDFNSKTGLLTVQAGKGNKQRQIFLNPDSRQVIRQWRNWRGNSEGKLFNPISKASHVINKTLTGQSVYDIIQHRAEQAQIGELRPHDLRRTFVTQLLEAGVDLNTTRQLAGHSDIQTTARYDLRDQKTQKRAVQLLTY